MSLLGLILSYSLHYPRRFVFLLHLASGISGEALNGPPVPIRRGDCLMPVKRQNDGQESAGDPPSPQPTLAGVARQECPDKISRRRGRLGMLCSLATLMVILHSHQEPDATPSLGTTPAMAQTYQGFGASTPGGSGRPIYRVKNRSDSGSGSLRDALSQGNRYIVFDVAGEINLNQDIWVRGAFITIDGTTAPAPGITLKNRALLIHGNKGAHDVIVRSIRSRNASGCDSCSSTGAGISIGTDAYNVVLDQVSIQGYDDEAISIGRGAHDVTVQWSIFAEGKNASHKLPILIAGKSSSTGGQTRRVSFHHNLIVKGYERMPQVKVEDNGEQATDTQLDFRNNLIWDWGYAATQVWKGARANVVRNYYHDPGASDNSKKRAIYMCHANSKPPQCQTSDSRMYARAYINGNVSGHGPSISDYLNSLGTQSTAFSAPTVSTTDACTAAREVLAEAGVRPLDAVDLQYVGMVNLTSCVTTLTSSLE